VSKGTPPLFYQWRKDGIKVADSERLSGAHSNILTISQSTPLDSGNWTAVVTSSFGSVTSQVATLTVVVPTIIPPGSLAFTNGQFEFTLLSTQALKFELQASTNLVNWSNLATLTNVTGTIRFIDPSKNLKRCFYRARQLP
jgi:hypothetical protein